MKAIVEIGGKDWIVSPNDVIQVPRLKKKKIGEQIQLDKVKAVLKENGAMFGSPYLEKARVRARVFGERKGRKVTVFKYKSKVNYRRKTGYRDRLTELKIEQIETGAS